MLEVKKYLKDAIQVVKVVQKEKMEIIIIVNNVTKTINILNI